MTENKHIDIEEFSPISKGFRKTLATTYEFYLSGYIDEPQEYVEWFDTIRNATQNDTVKIYINSQGGAVDTAIQFMRVISETDATVVCSIEGSCMSAATMIFLCAQEFEITPHSLVMLHNYSGGIFGKGGEIFDQAVFEREWSSRFLTHIYKDFLTDTEVKSLLDNKDIWLHSEDVLVRCQNLAKARNKQQKLEEALEE
jgi:ATP-dependent protease ClpP protease subunit